MGDGVKKGEGGGEGGGTKLGRASAAPDMQMDIEKNGGVEKDVKTHDSSERGKGRVGGGGAREDGLWLYWI